MIEEARSAKLASHVLATLDEEAKNKALLAICDALKKNSKKIFEANDEDLRNDCAETLKKRHKFREEKLEDSISGIKALVGLEDPIGRTTLHTTLDDGLELYRVTCPIGVIGVIFESRPDALVQIASLCLKSGNSVFLKGGSEALNTNKALADIIYEAGVKAGLPEGWLNLLTTRADVNEMLKMSDYIDLIIPRGSNEFVQYIMANTSIPVLGHADAKDAAQQDRLAVYAQQDADADHGGDADRLSDEDNGSFFKNQFTGIHGYLSIVVVEGYGRGVRIFAMLG